MPKPYDLNYLNDTPKDLILRLEHWATLLSCDGDEDQARDLRKALDLIRYLSETASPDIPF
jgi:hypothetical protein